MHTIPDFQIELTQATDYILDSKLTRHALIEPPFSNFANIVRDTLEDIDRLADNCHLPEFTDHALPHLCSMIKRISDWGWEGKKQYKWGEKIAPCEAGYLLKAVLVHDIGMLSQDPAHLESSATINFPKGLADVSNWVRSTHVKRMKKLYEELLINRGYKDFSNSAHFNFIIALACAHENWPWQERYIDVETYAKELLIETPRARGLAALLAVADLLDEDANRCDTATLIKHRQGTILNKAHWIRHALTANIEMGEREISIEFTKPPGTGKEMEQVYKALCNHYKLVKLYNSELGNLGANIDNLHFSPDNSVPDQEAEGLQYWQKIEEFRYCLPEQLLRTFMPEARNDVTDESIKQQLKNIGLEMLDLSNFKTFLGDQDFQTDEERIVNACWNNLCSRI